MGLSGGRLTAACQHLRRRRHPGLLGRHLQHRRRRRLAADQLGTPTADHPSRGGQKPPTMVRPELVRDRNFHGFWFTDSDLLESLVPFRQDTFQKAMDRAIAATHPSVRLAGKIPAPVIKNFVMKPLTKKPRGTMSWIEANDQAKINAYFGSRQEWESIGDWSTFWPAHPENEPQFLDHGYDETKDRADWTLGDMENAANFRGGSLVSGSMATGDITTPLAWECAAGHSFQGSPRLILTAGHWCPECVQKPADYAAQARSNRFLAQLETKIAASA